MKVAKHAEEIRNQLAGLAKELGAAQGDFDTLGKQLDWARENYEKAGRHFSTFAMKLQQYEQLSSGEGEGELEE
jgi:DNA anti-recombination protein RmuC